MTTPPAPRYAGLDGLRAIAVLLVVVYHLFPAWFLHSGFVGVDVFFVISGFLITSLLLREHAASGTVALRAFWTRRARRLLPALALVVTMSATAAWFVGGDVLVGLGRQVLGAATFSYNWVSIAGGASYFGAAEPELFRNLWSLAVEEQFYVLWPLLLPLVLLVRRRPARVALAAAFAAGSALWAVYVAAAGGLTRAYYGTDTHAFGLLIGVGLAFWLSGRAWKPARPLGGIVGGVAVAGVVAVSAWPDGELLYPGIPLAASLLTAVAIAAGVAHGSVFGRALDTQPLRWIGERSYGIYLWHWPLIVLVTVGATGGFVDRAIPVPLGIVALVLTLVLSALSYRFVEQPVRRLGFRGSLRALGARLGSTPARRFGALTAVASGVLVVVGVGLAVNAAPPVSSSEAVVQAGQDALDAAGQASAAPSATPAPTDADLVPTATPTVGPDGEPLPPPHVTVSGDRVSAVGDSVMLASAQGLLDRLPGVQVDAAVSRSMWAGDDIVAALAAQGALRDYVVVGLGTNGPVDGGALQSVYDAIGPGRSLVLVTASAPRDWIPGVNADLAAFAASHPRVMLADWSQAIAPHLDYLAGDQIHPGPTGGAVYADTVAGAVDAIENQRAQVRYELDLIRWMTARSFGVEAEPSS